MRPSANESVRASLSGQRVLWLLDRPASLTAGEGDLGAPERRLATVCADPTKRALGHDPSPDCLSPGGNNRKLVRLLGEGASRARWAQLKRFLRTGAGSPAKAVLVSTFETSTTRRWPRSVSTLTFMLVPAGTAT